MFLILLFIGILYRVIFFIHSIRCLPISTDEAFIGLLTKEILRGNFPLMSFGVGYQGPLESYLNVPVFLFLEPSPFSMRILTFICSIVFLILMYKLGKNIFDRKVGLLGLLFAGISPMYLIMAQSISIAPYNNTILVLGTLILILGYKLIYTDLSENKKIIYFTLLGFLSGVMLWVSMLVLYYIIPIFIFLFLKDKLFFIRKSALMGLLFFCIGSSPLWIYNFTHNFESFLLSRSVPFPEMFTKLKVLFSFTLPAIIGFHTPLYIDNTNFLHLPAVLGVLYSLVLIILFLIIFIFSIKGVNGLRMLLVYLAVMFFIFAKSERSNWWALRYLEPIFSVLPVLLAYGIYRIGKLSKIIAVVFTSIILISNLYAGVSIYKIWGDKNIVSEKLELPDTKELIKFLEEGNINRGYAHYWTAYRLTFETNEKIIISPPFDERFGKKPPYLDGVMKSPNVAYIFQKGLWRMTPNEFEENLKMIGGEYKRKEIGYFTVFYSFKSPYHGFYAEEIPRFNWKLESNFKDEDVKFAIDGNAQTRWGTGAPQSPGMYFLIDLGKAYRICKIRFDLGDFTTDNPRAYKIEVSLDKKNWQKVSENMGDCGIFWEDNQPIFSLFNYFNSTFNPVPARYIKITQLGSDPIFDWSIAEVNVYGAT